MQLNNIHYYYNLELIKRLRKVTMLKNDKIYPYAEAAITMEYLDPKILTPPQNYILSSALQNIIDLDNSFKALSDQPPDYECYDMFNLSGGFLEYSTFESSDGPVITTLLPPIIEESIEDDGSVKLIICDGMHRVYLSMIKHLRYVNCVYIRGIDKRYPYYAYPVVGGWDNVKVIDKLEPGYIKKFHRCRNNKALYRNFDSVFQNCSAPRGDIS